MHGWGSAIVGTVLEGAAVGAVVCEKYLKRQKREDPERLEDSQSSITVPRSDLVKVLIDEYTTNQGKRDIEPHNLLVGC